MYIFKCERWLSGLDRTEVILNAIAGKRKLPSPGIAEGENAYEITVTTGTVSKSPSPTRVYLSLIDADGRREERQLVPAKGPTESFQPGKVSCDPT